MKLNEPKIKKMYNLLLNKYGYQGWWPLINYKCKKTLKTKFIEKYHPKDYSFPKTKNELFEICIGCILTQNTSWLNVEKSLYNLNQLKLINPNKIINSHSSTIQKCIKPSGYFNLKTKYIKNFTKAFLENKWSNKNPPSRIELLDIKGVGNETADSILLYGFKVPSFVIDAYTKRILLNLKILNKEEPYNKIKYLFENSLEQKYELFQEFHALLVKHAKMYYTNKKTYKQDFLYEEL